MNCANPSCKMCSNLFLKLFKDIKNVNTVIIFLLLGMFNFYCCSSYIEVINSNENFNLNIVNQETSIKIKHKVIAEYIYNFKRGKNIFKLINGSYIFVSNRMTTDADGSPNYRTLDPHNGQKNTSYLINGKPLDAEKISYFVLPGASCEYYKKWGFKVGDIGIVIYKDHFEYAIFGDVGPDNELGEGSVKLIQELGINPINENGRIIRDINEGYDIITIIFPNSKLDESGLTMDNAMSKINEKSEMLFNSLLRSQ